VVITEDAAGNPLSIGRKTRVVSAAIRRAIYARDRHCRFPGCHNTRFLHIHHIRHWNEGGETSVGNGLLLCPRHHWLTHEGGYTLEQDWRGRWFFRRPDGRAVPECGYCPEDMLDEGAETAGAYFECRTVVAKPLTSAEASRASAEAPDTSAEAPHPSAEAPHPSEKTAAFNRLSRYAVEQSRICESTSDTSAEVSGVNEPATGGWMVRETSAEYHPLVVFSHARLRGGAPYRPRAGTDYGTRNTFMTSSPR
jgi:hypothetical protein